MARVETRDGINQLVGDTPPLTVGKFLDGNGLVAMLKNQTVKFCPPKELNDGWDCVPLQFRVEDILRAWEQSQLRIINPACRELFFDSYLHHDWKPFRDLLSTNIGVASFTDLKKCDRELMWERFGDDHKGGIVVLNTRSMGTFLRVEYQTRDFHSDGRRSISV